MITQPQPIRLTFPSPSAIAYLLVFHGSRDSRAQTAATVLSELFSQKLQLATEPHFISHALGSAYQPLAAWDRTGDMTTDLPAKCKQLVRTAYLECGPLLLHQQIERLAQELQAAAPSSGVTLQIQILPLFLLRGVHVMQDIPTEVALAQQALGQTVTIDIRPHLGSNTKLCRLLTERMAKFPVEAWILLAHGSRRLEASQSVEVLADRLGAATAYWSVPPSLESRLQELIQLGFRKLAILPFFLFSGSITDAIAQRVEQLSQTYPMLDLSLSSPLEASSELADLLVDLIGS